MRTISIIRWVNGLRALTPGLTVTAPAPARSGGDTTLTTPVPGEEATLATTVAMAHAAGNGTWTPAPIRNSLRKAPCDGKSTARAGLPDRTMTVSPAELPAATVSHGPATTPDSTAAAGTSLTRGSGLAADDGSVPAAAGGASGPFAGQVAGHGGRPVV
ncbi:hypothetical protein [Streptomyces decoyicus]|uniref:hypothetical protein n=1 Tax=Streptomyces decoyicus TaxID=249567 RepID=UPI000B2C0D64|nr:hypothetical protein [Streptomyces decoyicus]QZY16065.1 hypothetical protein K7C20_13025 [Streptomyces decoyicus]